MNDNKVVITGIGTLSSAGTGIENTWNGLVNRRPELTLEKIYIDDNMWNEFYLHKIPSFSIDKFGIDKTALNAIKEWKGGESVTDLEYLLASVKLAIDDSGISYDPEINKMGCVITHENPGLEQYFTKLIDLSFEYLNSKQVKKVHFAEYLHTKSIKSAYELQSFTVLFHIMKVFNLHGYSLFLNNACSSGLHAFENAAQIIRSGRCPAVVLAGSDFPRIYKYLWFKELNMYEKDGKMKPFDKNAGGLVFGDGGTGFILEDLEHARNRGAKIYAEYSGGGFTQEAWKTIYPNVISNHYSDAINEALTFSRCTSDQIDTLCAHGAAHPIIDRYEAESICRVFGGVSGQPVITALKPYVGHNLGGNNLLEIAILLICMQKNTLLPLINTENIHPKIKINLTKKTIKMEITTFMKICCAFAGYNAAAIFRKFKDF
ncbi:MAG: beta-ketoacyl synthase N-terminal-like domain-containing protein [Chitinispirillia bacterium]|jgi:3-oxoacyl-[acyl-carrier-protein] synthase II